AVESGGIFQAAEQPPFLPVEPGYRNALRLRYAILWAFLAVAALVFDRTLLAETPFAGALPIAAILLGLATVVFLPAKTYRRLRYRLTDRLLQVTRGWTFHTDTVVPLVRVQHLDVVRGPVDKMFGIATLVVHTAGTHNSIVTVPGLAPDRAAEMRDIIREQVRTDFE
ncbi:MAG TPA: PH domain-containing protein, partial [Sphingomicrobium sp.]|nr:PH domain-containing protein [Sphingomicrobium sp.]